MSHNGKRKGAKKVNHGKHLENCDHHEKPFSARGLVTARRQEAKTVPVPMALTIISTLQHVFVSVQILNLSLYTDNCINIII